ncbi:MAG TPA: hypothetical protein VHC97_25955 [Thermoanaerobaculia bacterium]|jgi:hypothetical protein|nr:hypothetical protein [Thermoanaerobaculia bacterium]
MAWGQKKSGGGAGRLALILSILALVLAWAAFRRTGGELGTLWNDVTRGVGDRVRVTAGDGSNAVERQAELARAQTRLLGRRAEVAAERNLEQVRRDVAEIRADLERSYRNASSGAKERWQGLDADLERLQGQLKDGGSKALDTLDSALAKIRIEARGEK